MKRTALMLAFALTLMPAAALAQTRPVAASYEGVVTLPSGAQLILTVDTAGEAVHVEAHGQEALDVLNGATPKTAARHAAYNDRAEAVLAGLMTSNDEALRDALHRRDRRRAFVDIQRVLDVHREAYGPMNAFRILGSVPRPDGGTYTYVEAVFGSQHVDLRMVWDQGHLVSLYPGRHNLASAHLERTAEVQYANR